ncbi:hypothetical protein [Streptantibioticus silvisoli]|uniref:hypothetical protein n=1 Tax=Streptantibioticus silvisoli TaxID=2705255 RepID=UPI0035583155
MSGTVWGVLWGVVVVGGWAGAQVRGALKTRHERRLEREAVVERRQQALEAARRPPEPVCGCTHHLAKHDKQGKCHEDVEAPVEWDADRKPVRFASRPCTCQQYVGPQPLPTLYAQELTDLD